MRFATLAWVVLPLILFLPRASGAQAIIEAAREGDEPAVRRLLAEDPGAVHATDEYGRTALHHSAAGGQAPLVKLLLGAGADPDLQDSEGNTPLHGAGAYGRDEVIRVLLEHEAKTELRDDYGRTPLLLVARESGSVDAARALLDHGADPDALDRFGASSLNLAAWRGFEEVVDVLLDHGARLNAGGGRAAVLPEYAAQGGLERLFQALSQAGADLGRRTENGGSLLHAAAEGGSEEIVGILLDRGFDVREKDRYGWAPLHYAAQRGREAVSELLISRGADVNAASVGGHTPLSVTGTYGKDAESRLLEAHGARQRPEGMSPRTGPWLGEKEPGSEPQLFAPDLVSSSRFEHGTVTFSPNGKEAFWESSFMPNETGYSYGRILTSRLEEGTWTAPEFASFSRDWMGGDDVPFFSPDGRKLYFLSRRPTAGEEGEEGERIWVVDRTATGWGEPSLIRGGPNTLNKHWQFSVADNGNIYFGSDDPGGLGGGDVWVSRFGGGAYQPPENLGPVINTAAGEDSPFIAPDESYLIFTGMDRSGSLGGTDLYISFRTPDGAWTDPLNLGAPVNTASNEMCPQVSRDGLFLFWNSRPEGNADNYWMDAGLIEALRATVGAEGGI